MQLSCMGGGDGRRYRTRASLAGSVGRGVVSSWGNCLSYYSRESRTFRFRVILASPDDPCPFLPHQEKGGTGTTEFCMSVLSTIENDIQTAATTQPQSTGNANSLV